MRTRPSPAAPTSPGAVGLTHIFLPPKPTPGPAFARLSLYTFLFGHLSSGVRRAYGTRARDLVHSSIIWLVLDHETLSTGPLSQTHSMAHGHHAPLATSPLVCQSGSCGLSRGRHRCSHQDERRSGERLETTQSPVGLSIPSGLG